MDGGGRLFRGGLGRVSAAACGVVVALAAGGAAAQTGAGAAPTEPGADGSRVEGLLAPGENWSLRVEISAWRPGLDGDYGLPGSPARDHDVLGLDQPEWTPYVEATIRAERFYISASAFSFDKDVDTNANRDFTFAGVALSEGDDFTLDLTYSSAQAVAGWRVWRWDSGHGTLGWSDPTPRFAEADDPRASLMLDLYGGARMYDARMDFRSAGGGENEHDFWLEPIVGAKLSIEMLRDFTVDVAVDIGGLGLTGSGDHTSSSLDITVGGQWRFAPHAAAQIGFRQLFFDLEDDGMALDGSLGGLYGSIIFEF